MSIIHESRTIPFEAISNGGRGKTISVQIIEGSERKIASGGYGTAYEVTARYGNNHEKKFVVKRFFSPKNAGEATKAVQNYSLAKQAGLNVFHTYRLGADMQSVIMTMGNTEDVVLIGTNVESPKAEEQLGAKIHLAETEKFDSLLEAVLNQARIAANHNIFLHKDAYFFTVDRKTKSEFGVIIGDYDRVESYWSARILETNLDDARISIDRFIDQNFENPQTYWDRLYDYFYENT
jgi:hypothetical protein